MPGADSFVLAWLYMVKFHSQHAAGQHNGCLWRRHCGSKHYCQFCSCFLSCFFWVDTGTRVLCMSHTMQSLYSWRCTAVALQALYGLKLVCWSFIAATCSAAYHGGTSNDVVGMPAGLWSTLNRHMCTLSWVLLLCERPRCRISGCRAPLVRAACYHWFADLALTVLCTSLGWFGRPSKIGAHVLCQCVAPSSGCVGTLYGIRMWTAATTAIVHVAGPRVHRLALNYGRRRYMFWCEGSLPLM